MRASVRTTYVLVHEVTFFISLWAGWIKLSSRFIARCPSEIQVFIFTHIVVYVYNYSLPEIIHTHTRYIPPTFEDNLISGCGEKFKNVIVYKWARDDKFKF